MQVAPNQYVTIEEYIRMKEETTNLLEYIDGIVYMSPSPSTKHQRISSRLQVKLGLFLSDSGCEVFSAPYDIELRDEKMEGTKIVIPDLSVICDKSGFTDTRYVGVPTICIEILSPSNQSHDLITKLNLYMNYGVAEYWIINPMLDAVTIYTLNEKGMYDQYNMKTDKGTLSSKMLSGFSVELEELFA